MSDLIEGETQISCGCTEHRGKLLTICKLHFALIEQNVLLEREGCASMVEGMERRFDDSDDVGGGWIAIEIADAIRARSAGEAPVGRAVNT